MVDSNTLTVELQKKDLPPAEAVNFFNVSRVGAEVQVTAAFIDLHQVAIAVQEAKASGKPMKTITVEATHRLVMGLQGFTTLRAQIEQIAAAMTKDGTLPQGPKGPSGPTGGR